MSEATLQTLAYSLGIDKLVRNMTESEKAQLRYIQIMRSTSEWQTDMGRTLVTPANALRVMKQQFTQLGRAIGNVFIPIVMLVMPYIIALTQLITALAKKIAEFVSKILGIKIVQDIDYSNLGEISAGITDIGTSADKTTDKLNTMLAPFDDLNVVQNQSKSGGAGSGLGGLGGDLGVPLPEYNALANLNEKFAQGVERAKKNIESMLPIIIAIGGALATWKIAKSVIDFMSWWKDLSKVQKAIARVTLGVIATVLGTTLKFSGDEDVRHEETLMQGIAKQLGGAILTGVGVGVITKNVFIGIAVAGMSLSNSGVITMSHGDEEQFHTGLAEALGGTVTTFGATFAMTKSVEIALVVTIISTIINIATAIQELMRLKPTWEELCDAIAEVIGNSFIGKLSDYITDGLTDFFIDLGNTIGDGLYDAWELATDFWDKHIAPVFTKEWWKTHVVDKVSGAFEDIKTETSKKWDETWVNIGNTLETGKTTLSNKFTQIKEDIPKKWSDTWTNVKDTAKTKWTDAKTWLSNNIGNKETWKNRFKGILDGASNILSELKKKFENWSAKIKTPHISWSSEDAYKTSGVVKKALEALNLPTSIPKLKVKWYEQGGYPTSGDLFFANENGVPEMVGQIGNQTAVANNDQITTSITNALISALNQYDFGGGKAPTTIYIGNRKVYEGYGDYMAEENDRYGTNMIKI